MKGLTGAAVLVATTLAASACGGYQVSSQTPASTSSTVSAGTVSSTGLILDGRVRCTATVSTTVKAGDALGLTFAVRNVSDPQIKAEGTLRDQAAIAAQIYKGFGRWSTVCSAIVCWALIAP